MIKTLSNKYEPIKKIASGGMGSIYMANQKNLNRIVAVKVLHPQFSSDISFLERFQREARSMARLDHPNIVRVYDVDSDKDIHYIVMEYIEGSNLSEILKAKGCFESSETVKVAKQVALALSYAHHRGIIHRDIKPGNIMISESGLVKVGDFGIAAAVDEISLTVTGQLLGTPEYMSPEQARGEEVDQKMDIYSLGMVMYKMLTGKTPFDGMSKTSIIGEIVSSRDDLDLDHLSHVPHDIKKTLRQLLTRDINLRYPSAEAVIEDMELLLCRYPEDREQGKTCVTEIISGREQGRGTEKPAHKRIKIFSLFLSIIFFSLLAFLGRKYWETDIKTHAVNDSNINNYLPPMVYIEEGCFTMGNEGKYSENDESPLHEVCVDDFFIGEYEITFKEYDYYCDETGKIKPDDNGWGRLQRPVMNVTWHDADEYTEWLSGKTGNRYRLPTEAEWEYAAKMNERERDIGNFSGKRSEDRWESSTSPVGSFQAGKLGLYDMRGNVMEWAADIYSKGFYKNSPRDNPHGPLKGYSQVVRGGSWITDPDKTYVSNRYSSAPYGKNSFLGFRVVMIP